MYKHGALFLIISIFIFSSSGGLFAQQKSIDTAQLQRTATYSADTFYKAIGLRSRLYNGETVDPYDFVTTTNANFKDTTVYNNGNVTYDGITYNNIPLIYNMDRDLVISHLYNQFAPFSLVSNKVSTFDVWGHHFIRLESDSLNKLDDAGFYDELYNNKLLLLARRTKSIQQESMSRGVAKFFVEKTTYYLKKGGLYHEVNSQGRFLDVLKDKKKELKQYLNDNKIRYRDNPERVMAMIAAYYDHLTN
jgi:hypothetical protein